MPKNSDAPWRSLTIEAAVAQVAEPLIKRGLATKGRAASDKEMDAADKRLGRPLHADMRVFYRHVRPVPECTQFGGGSIGFQPIGDADLTWLDDRELRHEMLWVGPNGECWLKGWTTARLLVIGYTEFGDWLMWCDGLEGRNPGTIVLGDTLAQWLGRYFTYGFIEYSIAEGSLDEVEPAAAQAFLRDHLRLNPHCKWAKQKLGMD
jgi:hypothetical protein